MFQVQDVLWIGPGQWPLPKRPDGYPFRVLRFHGPAEENRVYVYGVVLDARTGEPTGEDWLGALPFDQPKATIHEPPPGPAVGVAPVRQDWAELVPRRPYLDQPRQPDYAGAATHFIAHRQPADSRRPRHYRDDT